MLVEHTASDAGVGVGQNVIALCPMKRRTGGRLAVFCHALGGNAFGPQANAGLYGLRELADRHGVYTVATDMGGDNWGFNYQSRIDAAIAYAATKYGVVTDEIVLIAQSMGNYAAYNYAADNPEVAALVSIIPNIDLATKYADVAFTASINTAYGGDASGQIAAHNPWARQAAIAAADVPVQAWFSSNDPYETVAKLQEFHAGIGGAEEHNMGAIGHSGAGVDGELVAAFVVSRLA